MGRKEAIRRLRVVSRRFTRAHAQMSALDPPADLRDAHELAERGLLEHGRTIRTLAAALDDRRRIPPPTGDGRPEMFRWVRACTEAAEEAGLDVDDFVPPTE